MGVCHPATRSRRGVAMTPSLFDISGKVAIVTGASRGIGQSIAEEYAKAGAKVVLASRKQADLDTVAHAITLAGGDVIAVAAHSGQKQTLIDLVAATLAHFGRLDIVVNNAATNPHFGNLLDAEDSLWMKTIEVNVMGNVWLTQAAVPHLRAAGSGRVINIASVNGLNPGQFQGIYSATKAAIISITKTLAMELGPDHITVNAIAPGLIQTKFAQVLWENDKMMAQVEAKTPLGRIGQPIEIAGLALWLASPAASFVTGAVYTADGGMTLGSM